MLWLDNAAEHVNDINFFNIDCLKEHHNANIDDQLNAFFELYQRAFKQIYKASDFKHQSVCFERVLIQPKPMKGFVWAQWHKDDDCSLNGPSSLVQRWNIHTRKIFGLLPHSKSSRRSKSPSSFSSSGSRSLSVKVHGVGKNSNSTYNSNDSNDSNDKEALKVVVIIRVETVDSLGRLRLNRLISNQEQMLQGINETLRNISQSSGHLYQMLPVSLSNLSYPEQVALMASTTILIGMHGAGISHSTHMPVGNPNCCGLLEIFPQDSYRGIRGYGNLARRLGLHYDRVDIDKPFTSKGPNLGSTVPVQFLCGSLAKLILGTRAKPSCVLPQVYEDPYLKRAAHRPLK